MSERYPVTVGFVGDMAVMRKAYSLWKRGGFRVVYTDTMTLDVERLVWFRRKRKRDPDWSQAERGLRFYGFKRA